MFLVINKSNYITIILNTIDIVFSNFKTLRVELKTQPVGSTFNKFLDIWKSVEHLEWVNA